MSSWSLPSASPAALSLPSAFGEHGEGAAPVVGAVFPGDQAGRLHPGDLVRQAAA
jgi:hypothetical protein